MGTCPRLSAMQFSPTGRDEGLPFADGGDMPVRPLPSPLQGLALPSGFTSTDATASAASSTSIGHAANLHDEISASTRARRVPARLFSLLRGPFV